MDSVSANSHGTLSFHAVLCDEGCEDPAARMRGSIGTVNTSEC